ncbi:MAG: ABC transporter ATP-binding protein [Nitrospirales bacterium]
MIRFDHVFKEFSRGAFSVVALRDVCLEIPQGEFCALMGPSGSGKSTLLHLVAGLDTATSGEIVVDGRSTKTFGDQEWTQWRRIDVGMVFQAFHLLPGLTIEENVALPLRLRGERGSDIRGKVREMLDLVGLGHRMGHRSQELSGGEQQRVAIARAFVHRPRLILADEPTGNLDGKTGAGIVTLLGQCAKEFGQTILLATHALNAAQAADRVLAIRDGQLE